MDSNILMNQIKARLILEEKTADAQAKLSTEFYIYKKEDIKRIVGKRKKRYAEDATRPTEDPDPTSAV
jgi:hypothetical protein